MSNLDPVYSDEEVAELQERARKLRAKIARAHVISWVCWPLGILCVLFAFVGWQFIKPTELFASIAAPGLVVAFLAAGVAKIWGRSHAERAMLAATEAQLATDALDRAQRELKRRR